MTSGHDPFSPTHWVAVEPSPRRVRVVFADVTVADSQRVTLFRESRHIPVYYFPRDDVRTDLLAASDHVTEDSYKGAAYHWTLCVGGRVAEDAVWGYRAPLPEWPDRPAYFAFDWNKMDHWYEEDEEVFAHPRDPYHRVDVVQSSRHVRVMVAGEVVAESRRPRLLFETGHPTRYYLPVDDVRMDLLAPLSTHTRCPYKGLASYWAINIGPNAGRDIAWSYLDPIPECPKVKDLIAFFNERVDALEVDREAIPKPVTRWGWS